MNMIPPAYQVRAMVKRHQAEIHEQSIAPRKKQISAYRDYLFAKKDAESKPAPAVVTAYVPPKNGRPLVRVMTGDIYREVAALREKELSWAAIGERLGWPGSSLRKKWVSHTPAPRRKVNRHITKAA